MSRAKISELYKRALYCYGLPLVFLALVMAGVAEGLFSGLFLLSLFPLAVAGLVFTGKGLRLSSQTNDREKKDIGYANLIMGLILSVIGLLAFGFAYIRT
jgi:hypothetical protein